MQLQQQQQQQQQQAGKNSFSEMNQQDDQDHGSKPNILNQQQQNQLPPQKCPRCDSLNTKFCYYNNYSLTQPRHFCKACRRYWTQGGTLRNVPVGGGCRKKRARTTSSSSPAVQQRPEAAQMPMQEGQQMQKNLAISTAGVPAASPVEGSGGLASYGYNLSSYATINHHHQSLNNTNNNNPAYAFSDLGGVTSNLGLLQGFNQSLYPSQQSNRAAAGADHHGWPHQSFMTNRSSSSAAATDSVLWANPATTSGNIDLTTTAAAAATTAGFSLNPIQWPDLHGSFDPSA